MLQQFEAHGTLTTKIEGRILVAEGTGPWNLESLDKSGNAAAPQINVLAGKPWAALVILHGECIYVHEASKVLIEIIKQERKEGRRGSAILVNDSDSPSFAKQHLTDIFNQAGETFDFFDNVEAARAWLDHLIKDA
ncbi:hypothetical protein [Aliiglaciecola litoralis]|uniref:STAS/SEC14 domain-containing protein n=1 Tax=Aliiglaciecola litoralis TaxID=582857 RepID=A0ABP3WU23_9ALTE